MNAPTATEPRFGPDGLTDADRAIVRDAVARYPDIEHVTLFGSRAMGTFGRGSDVDLALEGRALTRATVAKLAADLEDSDLPYDVDLLLRDDKLDAKVEAHIWRHGKPFRWRKCTLGDVIELKRGYDLPTANRRAGSVPIVSSSGLSGRHDEIKVKAPGVVTGRYGTIGEVFFISEDFWPLNTTLYVRDFKGNDERFVAYFLRSLDFLSFNDKSSVPGLNRNDLHLAPVMFPPVDEQVQIAAVLGALDDKIEQNRRTGRALEGLARATFKAWFVDFEPVKAKAAGAAAFPGMPAELFATLPTRLVDSELGPVPEGWDVRAVSEAFDVNPTRRLAKGADAPYLDMKNMPTVGHAPEMWERRAVGSGMKFKNGDTLVARITPCLENGKTAYVDFLEDGDVAWGSTEYIVLRPKTPLPPVFGYCLARTQAFRDFAIQNMSGTSGRQRVASTTMDHYRLAVPTASVAEAFDQFITPLFESIRAGMNESRKLAALRDYLLPRLLSGKVRVWA